MEFEEINFLSEKWKNGEKLDTLRMFVETVTKNEQDKKLIMARMLANAHIFTAQALALKVTGAGEFTNQSQSPAKKMKVSYVKPLKESSTNNKI